MSQTDKEGDRYEERHMPSRHIPPPSPKPKDDDEK